MPGVPTPVLGLTVPMVGGDVGAWGEEMNANLATLDGLGAFFGSTVFPPYNVLFGIFPEVIVAANGGGAVTLPPCSTWKNKIALIKKIDAGIASVIISCVAGLVELQPSYQLANQLQYVRLWSDGINCWNVGNN